MKHLGRVIGVAAILAVPAGITWWLASRAAPPMRPPAPTWRPQPLPTGDAGPGLTFALQSDADRQDVRPFAHLALFVPAGQPASDFLPAGPFIATFRGTLAVPSRDRYRFSFVGTGALALRIDGREVAVTGDTEVELSKGSHPLVARYRSPNTGVATMRVYWQAEDLAREPVPAAALRHASSPALLAYGRLRRGRELGFELRCGGCHEAAGERAGAPSLVGVGSRLQRDWMAKWIADPRSLRHGATMPKLLRGASAEVDARDMAAFLATRGAAPAALAFPAGAAAAGGRLFASAGCIGCHTLPGHVDAKSVGDRVPLAQVKAKWHPAALVDFLMRPTEHYPKVRMPTFGFTAEQARQLAAFVLGSPGAMQIESSSVGDPVRGQELVAQHGCASCHGFGVPSRLRAPARPIRGDSIVCGKADYALDGADRAALREFFGRDLPGVHTDLEHAERTLQAQRCHACHERDGRAATRSTAAHELAARVQPDPDAGPAHSIPSLTHTGAKLRTEWLVRWLAGGVSARPRPWLAVSMPRFALDAERVARGLAAAHGFAPSGLPGVPGWQDGTALRADTVPRSLPAGAPPVAELRGIGRQLLPQDGGFGCTQCHAVGAQAAEQVFEAPGIGLEQATVRLRKEYFFRWMWNPPRIDPTTKMTRFVDAEGRTGLGDVLDGDGAAQLEAIWSYLESLR
ncbi:MAG: c-type cytochrome [Planctomycetes bacterium]|nr:c-type cytochrome [Planctomycetota bacterium]MCB9869103.1 c-type cytochrome [Planctomycetota bacterium]